MTTFVDTSALIALLDAADGHHATADEWMRAVGSDPSQALVTHSYVVVEAEALAHRRLGMQAVRALLEAWIPALAVLYVDEHLHRAATSRHLARLSRRSSLVDSVSFEMMRDSGIRDAFTFDTDFEHEGFRVVP